MLREWLKIAESITGLMMVLVGLFFVGRGLFFSHDIFDLAVGFPLIILNNLRLIYQEITKQK